MDNTTRSNTGTGLGIAGLVLGILSIPLGIMGCTFIMGLVMGIMGVTLSAVGLSQARKANSPSGLILAGLIVSIMGTSFAFVRFTGVVNRTKDKAIFWRDRLEKYQNNTQSVEDHIDETLDDKESINDNNVRQMQNKLEELEKDVDKSTDKTQKRIDSTMEQIDKNMDRNLPPGNKKSP